MKKIAKFFFTVTVMVLLFSRCVSADYGDPGDSGSAGSPYDTLNPERGWYIARGTGEADPSEFMSFKSQHVSIVVLEADLGLHNSAPLSAAKLDEISNAFSYARQAGLSVIFRAAYSFPDDDEHAIANPEPTSMTTITGHIDQLGPIFAANEDILFNVQAGFLGEWGEWHHTYYGNENLNTNTNGGSGDYAPFVQYQRQVVDELLSVVPESVSIAVRRPEYIRNIADPNAALTGRQFGAHDPVTPDEAFGTTAIARLAFHNDALMSDDSDMDTYYNDLTPGLPNSDEMTDDQVYAMITMIREQELTWINGQTRYTPMVAESNLVSPYNNVQSAIPLLDRINIQSMNLEYDPDVLNKWRKSNYKGMSAFDYISQRIGYLFVLNSANIVETPDNNLRVDLNLVNSGFGHLLKKKNFELVLKNGSVTYSAAINEDARFWDKNETISRTYTFKLPSGITPGEWDVYLGLVSTFDSLADNPAYSVSFVKDDGNGKFTNKGMWDAKSGLNKIGAVELTNAPPGGNGDALVQISGGN